MITAVQHMTSLSGTSALQSENASFRSNNLNDAIFFYICQKKGLVASFEFRVGAPHFATWAQAHHDLHDGPVLQLLLEPWRDR